MAVHLQAASAHPHTWVQEARLLEARKRPCTHVHCMQIFFLTHTTHEAAELNNLLWNLPHFSANLNLSAE